MNTKSSHAIGIDLGTTFSVVAYLDHQGKPETIRNSEGDLTTPSVVFFDRDQPIVGKEAVKIAIMEPEHVVRCAKREVGKDFFHQSIRDEQLPPEVIQALILKKIKEDTEMKLGDISQVVITVPAFFNEPRRKSTQDAGALAGLEVIDIINEPTAAAIAYGVQQEFLSETGATRTKERILVYDLGGGTFDVTLLDIDGHQYHAIATAGDVYLGGIDWDQRIIDHVATAFQEEHGVDLREDPVALQTLIQDAEDAKRSLTQRESVNIGVNQGGQRLRVELTRDTFERMTEDLVQRTIFTTQKLLERAQCSWSELTRILLVGGASRMPMVQKALEGQSGLEVDRSLDPDECVAHGAAIYAGILIGEASNQRPHIEVTNVNSHDLGVLGQERATGMTRQRVLLARNTPLPATGSAQFTTRKDNQRQVAVEVVEGGDASGNNATPIGRCLVTGLPANLPAGTPVNVQFTYTKNGRLEVAASVIGTKQETSMVIERASGLSPEDIDCWKERVLVGFEHAAVSPGETVTDPVSPLPSPEIIAAIPVSEESSEAFPVLGEETPATETSEESSMAFPVLGEETPATETSEESSMAFPVLGEETPATETSEESSEVFPVVEEDVEAVTLVNDNETFALMEDTEPDSPETTPETLPPVTPQESKNSPQGPEVIYESDEEVVLDAIPASPDDSESSNKSAADSEPDDFFANLSEQLDSPTENDAAPEAEQPVDEDLNDFFKNFD